MFSVVEFPYEILFTLKIVLLWPPMWRACTLMVGLINVCNLIFWAFSAAVSSFYSFSSPIGQTPERLPFSSSHSHPAVFNPQMAPFLLFTLINSGHQSSIPNLSSSLFSGDVIWGALVFTHTSIPASFAAENRPGP